MITFHSKVPLSAIIFMTVKRRKSMTKWIHWNIIGKSWFEVLGLSFMVAVLLLFSTAVHPCVLMDVFHRHDSWIPFSLSSLRVPSLFIQINAPEIEGSIQRASARYYVNADKRGAETKGRSELMSERFVTFKRESGELGCFCCWRRSISLIIQQKDYAAASV